MNKEQNEEFSEKYPEEAKLLEKYLSKGGSIDLCTIILISKKEISFLADLIIKQEKIIESLCNNVIQSNIILAAHSNDLETLKTKIIKKEDLH